MGCRMSFVCLVGGRWTCEKRGLEWLRVLGALISVGVEAGGRGWTTPMADIPGDGIGRSIAHRSAVADDSFSAGPAPAGFHDRSRYGALGYASA